MTVDADRPDYESSIIPLHGHRLGENKPNLASVQGLTSSAGGGGMDGDVSARLAKLEAEMAGVRENAGILHGDFRIAIGAGVGAAVAVAAMVVASYLMLSGQAEGNRREMTDLIRYEVGRLAPPSQPPL